MVWRYEQSTGRMYHNGVLAQTVPGYSGKNIHKNRPSSQSIPNHGPIPRGNWTIGGFTSNKGPLTITLTPKPGTGTFGRSNFRIHGDSISSPGAASDGCIILMLGTRQMIVGSGDPDLEVVQ
jgi:hypothetical protein